MNSHHSVNSVDGQIPFSPSHALAPACTCEKVYTVGSDLNRSNVHT